MAVNKKKNGAKASVLSWFLTIFFAMAALAIFLSGSITAFAHSGRTDSDGGHTDHSTGEYHWHHGYPAHQHEDRDGDGYPEYCPYRIQGGNSNSGDRDCGREGCTIAGPHGHINKEPDNEATTQPIDSDSRKDIDWKSVIGIAFAFLILSPFILSLGFFVWERIVACRKQHL